MIAPEEKLRAATSFLTHIGLQWQWQAGATGFTEHIDIRCGILLVDPRARVSGVLHEAGHLATLPGDFRPLGVDLFSLSKVTVGDRALA